MVFHYSNPNGLRQHERTVPVLNNQSENFLTREALSEKLRRVTFHLAEKGHPRSHVALALPKNNLKA